MRTALAICIIASLTLVAEAETVPIVGLIFEYTVAPDGTRRNIRIVQIEQAVTHKDFSSALTQAEKLRGIRNVSKRKRVPRKDAGRKLYEVAVFDLRTRKYISEE